MAIVQCAQRSGGCRVDRFLPDHVVDRVSRDRAAVIQGNSLDHGGLTAQPGRRAAASARRLATGRTRTRTGYHCASAESTAVPGQWKAHDLARLRRTLPRRRVPLLSNARISAWSCRPVPPMPVGRVPRHCVRAPDSTRARTSISSIHPPLLVRPNPARSRPAPDGRSPASALRWRVGTGDLQVLASCAVHVLRVAGHRGQPLCAGPVSGMLAVLIK